jgi:hypothetical protein
MKVVSLWEINKIWICLSEGVSTIIDIDLSIDEAKELASKLDSAIKDFEATDKGLEEYLSRDMDNQTIQCFADKV